jgi:hypothetical protein
MSEIIRDLEGATAFEYSAKMEALARAMLDSDQDVVFFLGAGASLSPTGPSLPSGTALAKELAEKSHLDWHKDLPLSTAAFYYESLHDRSTLNDYLRARLLRPDISPSPTLKTLMELITLLEKNGTQSLIVTTNYDQKCEEEYQRKLQRPAHVIVYRGATDPNLREVNLHTNLGERFQNDPENWIHDRRRSLTCIYKMHGCISEAVAETRHLVVTEEDYINFLTNAPHQDQRKRILRHVRGQITNGTVLFVGYSLSDWNFRVIYKATAEANPQRPKAYAVQYFSPVAGTPGHVDRFKWNKLVTFWERKNVNILNVDATLFMNDLLAAVKQRAEIPSAAKA